MSVLAKGVWDAKEWCFLTCLIGGTRSSIGILASSYDLCKALWVYYLSFLFLRYSHFSCSRSHTPSFVGLIASVTKSSCPFLYLLKFILKNTWLNFHTQDCTHQSFVWRLFNILWTCRLNTSRKPRVLLAFVQILLTCVFHFKSLAIVMRRNLIHYFLRFLWPFPPR